MSTERTAAITDNSIVLTPSRQCEHSFSNIYVWVWWIWCQGRRWLELWQQFQSQIDFLRNQIWFVIDTFFNCKANNNYSISMQCRKPRKWASEYFRNDLPQKQKIQFQNVGILLIRFFFILNIVFHYSRVDTRGKFGFGKLLII